MTFRTVAETAKFMAHKPYLLATFGGYRLFEHPTRGDSAPVYMTTPNGTLINTGFYDLGDFAYHDLGDNNPEGLALCMELESDHINAYQELGAFEEKDSAKESAQNRWLHHESEDTLDLY